MPHPDADLKLIEHRRLALRAMPPGELRDDYLLYLEDAERRARAAAGLPPLSAEEQARRDADAGPEPGGWSVRQVVLAAAGFGVAWGVWALTSLR
jgi:hypothetical protein